MALVDYSSSSEDDDGVSNHAAPVSEARPQQARRLKRKSEAQHELPPLPSKFHDLYASNVRTTTHDDPALHGGRKRIRPHVEGNWPTHLYIEWWPQPQELKTLSKLIASFSTVSSTTGVRIESLLESELGAPLPLHISLSRSLTLTLQNKASFLSRTQSAVSTCSIFRFTVQPEKCAWVSNYEKTRWFLVLSLARLSGDQLNQLLQACNSVAAEFGQPLLYDSASSEVTLESTTPTIQPLDAEETTTIPSEILDRSSAFHISIAWTITQPSALLIATTQDWNNDHVQVPPIEVNDIKVKIGNAVTSIPLTPAKYAKAEKKSLFGV